MYLHKNGCKYYMLAFRALDLETATALKDNQNQLSVRSCINNKHTNPIPYLTELLKHSENIENHIKSEENVLKQLITQIHNITFIEMKKQPMDPEFVALASIIDYLKRTEEQFHKLKPIITESLTKIEEYSNNQLQNNENPQTRIHNLINYYRNIREILESIERASNELAKKITEFTLSIQKEKELIKKEEETLTDFNKNMMSWF